MHHRVQFYSRHTSSRDCSDVFSQLWIDVMIFFIVSDLAKVLGYTVIKKWSNFWIYFGLGETLSGTLCSTRKWITCKSIRHSNRTLKLFS